MAKQNTKSKSKKKQKNPFKSFVSVFMMLIASFLTYSAAKEVITTIQLQQEIVHSNAELSALQEEEASLNNEKVKLEDPEYVKRIARGKLQLSKEGEMIYRVSPDEETADEK